MTKIRQYDEFIKRATRNGFTLHSCGEYLYKNIRAYKDTYIYVSIKDKTLWVERGHEIVQGLDDIVLLPKRLQRYV